MADEERIINQAESYKTDRLTKFKSAINGMIATSKSAYEKTDHKQGR